MTNPVRMSVLVAAACLATPLSAAHGQPNGSVAAPACLPHEQIEDRLLRGFNEKKLGHGISGDGNLIEVFMSSAGNFTVIKTSPSGVSCIVDFGEGWQTINQFETAWLSQVPGTPERFGR